jgi:hypothetical protein
MPLLVGAISAAALQAKRGWWLNSGRGVAVTVVVLFALGVIVGCGRVGSGWTRTTALWVGVMMGLTVTLWWMGPGTLWPIVWVVSSAITACAVLAGTAVGWVCRSAASAQVP